MSLVSLAFILQVAAAGVATPAPTVSAPTTPAATPSAAPAVPAAATPCRVIDIHKRSGGTPLLYVACPAQSVRLGPADQYSSSYNAVLNRLIVVRQIGARLAVALVVPDPSGTLLVEYLDREVGQRDGPAVLASNRVTVDVSQFATTGVVSIATTGSDGTAKTRAFDLSTRIKAVTAASEAAAP